MMINLGSKTILLIVLLATILLASGQVDVEDDVSDLDLDVTEELDQILDAMEAENVDSSIETNLEDIESGEDCDAAAVDETLLVGESNPIAEEPVDDSTVQHEEVDDHEPAITETTETNNATNTSKTEQISEQQQPPAQTGPFIDIFGDVLLSLEMV